MPSSFSSSGSVPFGRSGNSAVNVNGSPSPGTFSKSTLGRSAGCSRDSAIASPTQRGQELAHGLLEDLLAAHALQHHVGRNLALAEAGDLGAVDEVPERVPEVVLDLLGIEHHLQPRPAVLKHRRRRPHRLRTLDFAGSATSSMIPGLTPTPPGASATVDTRGRGGTVDAPDLGSGERELVEVQVLSPASRPRVPRWWPSAER